MTQEKCNPTILWLNRAYKIDRQIKSKYELIEMWKDLAAKCTASYSNECSQKSRNGDGYKYYCMIADAEADVKEAADTLVAIKKEVSDAIQKVINPTYRVLLEQRYLLCKSWDVIGDVLGYDSEHTRKRIHSQALRAIDIFIKHDGKCP